jgi:sodium transport system permease protein
MLIFMFGGFASMVPNLKLTATTAAIPVINVALLINDLFQFKYDYALLGIVFLSNVIYSLITVMVLGKIYNSEAILFSEGLSSVKFVTKRSEMKKGQIPGIGDMVLLSCVTMLLMLYVGTAAQLKLGFGGVAVTQAIILAAPILYGWYIKTDFVKLFSLRKPKLRELLGSFFLWVGVYSIEIIVSVILSNFMKESATNVQSTFDTMLEQPILLLVLVIALMPAVGEELLFRGFLFGTLRDKVKPMTAMLIVSAIFGIYHMSLIKFITTAILGFLLVWVVYQTGSIFCSILIHFCNNLLSVFIMKYPTEMAKVAPIIVKEKLQLSDYFILTAIGIAGIFVGEMFLHWKKKTLANNQNL